MPSFRIDHVNLNEHVDTSANNGLHNTGDGRREPCSHLAASCSLSCRKAIATPTVKSRLFVILSAPPRGH